MLFDASLQSQWPIPITATGPMMQKSASLLLFLKAQVVAAIQMLFKIN
jgi:hypothetical protein